MKLLTFILCTSCLLFSSVSFAKSYACFNDDGTELKAVTQSFTTPLTNEGFERFKEAYPKLKNIKKHNFLNPNALAHFVCRSIGCTRAVKINYGEDVWSGVSADQPKKRKTISSFVCSADETDVNLGSAWWSELSLSASISAMSLNTKFHAIRGQLSRVMELPTKGGRSDKLNKTTSQPSGAITE